MDHAIYFGYIALWALLFPKIFLFSPILPSTIGGCESRGLFPTFLALFSFCCFDLLRLMKGTIMGLITGWLGSVGVLGWEDIGMQGIGWCDAGVKCFYYFLAISIHLIISSFHLISPRPHTLPASQKKTKSQNPIRDSDTVCH